MGAEGERRPTLPKEVAELAEWVLENVDGVPKTFTGLVTHLVREGLLELRRTKVQEEFLAAVEAGKLAGVELDRLPGDEDDAAAKRD